jgi:nicotinamidase-related amidase
VIASAISAWDLGYQVLVVEDACVGGDAEQHAAAITVMGSMGMSICSTEELLERLPAAAGAVSMR